MTVDVIGEATIPLANSETLEVVTVDDPSGVYRTFLSSQGRDVPVETYASREDAEVGQSRWFNKMLEAAWT